MIYTIFKMIKPELLQTTRYENYYTHKVNRIILEELTEDDIVTTHKSLEDAVNEIRKNSSKLKNETLTVLPEIYVNYEGELNIDNKTE